MVTDAQMSLMMRIKADGKQAIRELKRVRGEVKSFATTGLGGKAGRGIMGAGSFGLGALRKTAGAAMGVFRKVAKWGAVAGGVLGGLGVAAVKTAGNFQEMRMRLEAVLGSAQRSARVWKQSESFFGKSKFFLSDIIEARILLESIGVAGSKAIRSVGGAAAVLGRKLGDVATIVASMENEPLRRLGIELRRVGEVGTFTFMDKMQRMRKVTAKGTQAMRKALLGIFDLKFGGAIEKTLGIFSGQFDMLLGNLQRGMARFGQGLLPVLQPLLERANISLSAAMDTGRIERMGQAAGKWLQDAIDKGAAFGQTLLKAAGELRAVLKDNPRAFGDAIAVALGEGAGLLGTTIIESIKATAGFFKGVAQMFAAMFGKYIYQLPGMGGARDRAAREAIRAASGKGLVDIGEHMGIRMFGGQTEADYRATLLAATEKGMNRPRMVSEKTMDWLATEGAAGLYMQRGLQRVTGAGADAKAAIAARAGEARRRVNAQLLTSTGGFDFGKTYAANLEARRAAREMVTHIMARPRYAYDNTGARTQSGMDVRAVEAQRGAYDRGDTTKGGYRVVVNVAKLNMTRGGIQEVVRRAVERAAGGGQAFAGAY